jgi:hypothetical protein
VLKVHLEPAEVTAVPAQGTILTLVVTNDGDRQRSVRVRVVGLDDPWVEHSAGDLTVPAGSRLEVPIRVTLPHGYPRGEKLVGFEVHADGEALPMVVDATLHVSDLESLLIGLSPVTVRGGWRGRFKLNIENKSKDPLTIKLSGRGVGPDDVKSDLDFTFKPEEITLRPGERVKTRGYVSGKRHVFGAPKRRALTVTAQGETAPRLIQGAFVQRPLMPRNVMRIVGIVLVLALWAGGLSAGVKMTSGKGKESAEDASAVTNDPNAAGVAPGDTASGDAAGDGSEAAGTNAAGGAIAGQVKGPVDPSGITVKLRPVALADDLSDTLTAQNVSFVAAGEETSKESAQTLRREPEGPVGPTSSTTTDSDGRWAFGGLKTPANYEITFSKAGFGERTYIVSVDDSAPTVDLPVDLVPGNGALSGTVKTADGPLGGAVVTVTDGTVVFRATTPDSGDDAGKWSIDGLTTPASYSVSVTHRGYGTESTTVNLGSGDSQGGVDLTMVAGVGSISGHISGAGKKLGNVTVTATNGDVTRTGSTLTEGDPGAYSLPQLPIPGDYTISVAGDGWIPQTMALSLKGNASNVDLDLVKTTATIVGTIRDAAGNALPSTGVTLSADKPIVKTLSAVDPAGTYELTGLTPGTYTLSFDRADFKTESTIVTVAAGDRKTVDTTLAAQVGDKIPKDAVIRGIVRSTTTGQPIVGVTVGTDDVSATSTASASTSATTDSTGAFVLSALAPGSYDLKFTESRYQTLTRTVRIAASSDTTIDVTMLILGGIQGVVTDLTATPIPDVSVTLVNDPDAVGQTPFSATATTDVSGQYSLVEQLQTGKYIATFSKAGYSTRSRNVEASAGSVTVGDTQLIELAQVHGTVQEPAPSISGGFVPLSDVTLVIERLQNGVWNPVVGGTATSQANGEYAFDNLTPGDYRITASKPSYGTMVRAVDDLQLREVRDGGIVLSPGAQTISGRLTFDDSTTGNVVSLQGATVSVNAITGYDTLTVFPFVQPHISLLTATTDATGNWSIYGQLQGTTAVYTYSGDGLTTQTVTVTAPLATPGSINRSLVASPRTLTGTVSLDTTSAATAGSVNVTLWKAGHVGGTATDMIAQVNPVGTGYTGTYTIPNVPVGTYDLVFERANFATVTRTGVLVQPGSSSVSVDLGAQALLEYASIAPHVTTGASVDLAGVTASMTLVGGTSTSALTLTNGLVPGGAFTQLTPGTWNISYSLAGYQTQTKTLTVASGENATTTNHAAELAIKLLELPDLTITLNSQTASGTFSALSTATLTATLLDGSNNETSTVVSPTRTGNTYTFTDLDPGTYRVKGTAANHDDLTMADRTMVADVDQSPTVAMLAWSALSIHLQSLFDGVTGNLTGASSDVNAVRTNDASGAPVTGQPNVPFTGGTGGIYTSAIVQPGTYLITADPDTHIGATATSTVTAGFATDQVDLTLKQKPRLSITVNSSIDSVLTDLDTATVTVVPHGGGTAATIDHTGGTNLYVADALAEGFYDITVQATDHDTQTFDNVQLVGGQHDQRTVDLLAWGSLSIHVRSHFGTATTNLTTAVNDITAVRILDAGGATVTGQPTLTFTGGASGIYTSDDPVQPGTYRITVAPSTHVPGTVQSAALAGTTPDEAALTVEQLPRITIFTQSSLDSVSTDLTTATVTLSHHTGGALVAVNQTATQFVADGLQPDSYDIVVSAPNHDTQRFDDVQIVAGQDYTDTVDLLKWMPLTIHVDSHFGTATDDLPGISASMTAVMSLDAGGDPPTGTPPTITFTGGTNGDYTSSSPVEPGTYTITANPATHLPGTVDQEVVAGTTPTPASLTLQGRPRIVINVLSQLDSTNIGLSGATVTVTRTDPGFVGVVPVTVVGATATADSLEPGTYKIDVQAADHDDASVAAFTVDAGDDLVRNVPLAAWSPLKIHIQSHFGTATTNLTSIAGNVTAVMTLDADGGTPASPPTITFTGGGSGIYTSSGNVEPGTYTISASPTGYLPGSVASVTVTAGSTPSQPDLVLEHLPRIVIDVLSHIDSTDVGLSGATVTVTRTDPGFVGPVAVTVVGSTATADDLQPGTYRIDVQAADHDDFTGTPFAVAAGDDVSKTAALDAWSPLTIHIQSHFGTATTDLTSIAGSVTATMTLDADGGTPASPPTITFTGGGSGIYTSSGNVEPGTYTISASPTGYLPGSVASVTVTAGSTPSQPDLVLEHLPRIVIDVLSHIDSTDVGLSGATVTVTRTDPGFVGPVAVTVVGSTATADNLQPGTYRIDVQAADHDDFTGTPFTVDAGDDLSKTAALDAWSPLKIHIQSHFGTATTNLTSIAGSVTATMTLDADGGTPTSPPTITFTGGGSGIYTSSGNVEPGTYTISASPTGYLPGSVASVTVTAGTTPTQPDLVLEHLPRIVIDVLSHIDSTNVGLSGATVTVTNTDLSSTVPVTVVGSTATADNLQPGNYRIDVQAADHDDFTGTPFAVAAGDDLSKTAALDAWSPLTIHIRSHFGTATTDLTSIAGNVTAVMTLDAGGATPTAPPTITFGGGTGGVYTSDDPVEPGTYTISANPTAHVPGSVASVTVAAGTTPTQADLVLEHLAQLTVVTQSKLDASTISLTSGTATITPQGGGAPVTISHPGGSATYTASNLTAGTYDILVTATNHDDYTASVTLADGDDTTHTAVVLRQVSLKVKVQGELSGVFTNLTTISGSVTATMTADKNGDPTTGTPTVYFSGGTNGVYTSTAVVPSGTYRITASPTGYDPNTVDQVATAGTTPTQASLIVQQQPKVTITVNSILDSVSTPLGTASVTLQQQKTDGSCCASSTIYNPSNINGNDYEFDSIPTSSSRKYKVVVTAPNHVGQTFSGSGGLSVVAGSSATMTVDLLEYPPLTLNLTGRNGATAPFNTESPLVGATATATATSGGTTTGFVGQGDGSYTIDNVNPGTYTMSATATGYAGNSQPGVVINGGATHSDVPLVLTAQPGSITGTVTDSRTGDPIEGVLVTASFSGAPDRTATSDVNGDYTIANVEPSTWSVTWSVTDYSPLTQDVTVTRNTATDVDPVLVQLGEHISGHVDGFAADPSVFTNLTTNPATALASVTVTLDPVSAPGATSTSTTTDASGDYQFADVPAGTYNLTFEHDYYKTSVKGHTATVAGSSNRTDNLTAHTGSVVVTVTDGEAPHDPVSNVDLQLSGDLLGAVQHESTDIGGVATFTGLPPGTYDYSIENAPSGYLEDATVSQVTLGPSHGDTDATQLAGTGVQAASQTISKAVGLDVTVAGLLTGDTATVTVAWTGGTASQTGRSNGTTSFAELPPGKAFTITATSPNYDDGTDSHLALALGATATSTVTLAPHPGSVDIDIDGLVGSETASVTIGGVTSSAIGDTATTTIGNVPAGTNRAVVLENPNYTLGSPTTLDVGAGAHLSQTITVTPKDGSLDVTLDGVLPAEDDGVLVTVTWNAGADQATGTTTDGVAHITGVPAGEALEVYTAKPTANYSVTDSSAAPKSVAALGANQQNVSVHLTVTPNKGTALVGVDGLTDGDTVDLTLSCTGCPAQVQTVSSGQGNVSFSNVPVGVLVTVTLDFTPYSLNTDTYSGYASAPTTFTITTAGGTPSPNPVTITLIPDP